MKKKYYLYVTLILLVLASVFWKSCAREDRGQDSDTDNTTSKTTRGIREPKSRSEEIRDFFKNADTRMDFFGRVVDQDGNGVEGVTINYRVQKAGDYLESGVIKNTDEKMDTLSNADGGFEIKGAKGLTLSIGPLDKNGYRDGSRSPRAFGFKSTPELHQADPRKPVEFVMVRSDVSKTREIYQKRLSFRWNQGDVRIPLGDKLGDFVLSPTRVWEADQLRNFDWKIKVRMDNAQLASLDDDSAEIAPEDGYQGGFEYGSLKGDVKWRGGVQARYAFKTSEGLYGSIRFNLYPEREDLKVNGSLDVHLNETGSRNLD
ncbi:MAG: carboxypeptidase regulatory-like domain-containing protein [Proteobacteria bacterium]|nr:MAG: carboxypeptidase regulatory-like domain-containing protein [Pseudomonadota bacterium]